ncbi:MAG TPA: SDR family oxidoreductase, partial [Acidimicrobiales bacterium]
MPIERDLWGKRFFITGATGFLGTALVERILRCIPEAEVTVLVRPGRRADAAARLAREVIKNDCFDRLRSELGDRFSEEVARRAHAVAGDVGQDGLGLDDDGRDALRKADVVIHSAATVSFDAPLTQAVEINLLGPSRVADAMAECGSNAHLIAVSTAYVASTHQGEAKEELLSENRFTLDVAWEEEVRAARRLKDDLDDASRRPNMLRGFTKKARSEVGAAGDHLIASRAEKLRQDWVSDELVEAGTARALSLGWPDAYPFTKAMGERALVDQWEGRVPITFVRPSIIESALAEPRPGWIRGFRMAEPIIVSYARGMLAEFPGVPEGIIDVIPVDLVVAAILAVAARGPEEGRPRVYQVASGVRNPLRYGRLVEIAQDFFARNPLYDDRGQPISTPEWSFPGRGRVQRQLRRADAAMTFVEKLITALPIRGKQAQLAARMEDRHAMAKRALGYVELYGAYTETDARYRVDNLMELWASCDEADHEAFEFDPGAIDWDRYVDEIHLPSVIEHTRVRTKPGRSVVDKRPERMRKAILSPDRHLAVFDLEHTLMSSNVVDTYAWLASRHLSPARRARFVADLVRQGPSLLALDRRDRGDFLRSFYRKFEDAPLAQLQQDSWELFHRQLLTRSFPDGFARVRAHRAAGHRTLLITGALDFIIEPIRPLFDDIVCAAMETRDGRLTGHLTTLPPIGEARALVLSDYADEHFLSLEES